MMQISGSVWVRTGMRCQGGVKEVSRRRCVLPCYARGAERRAQRDCMAVSKVLNGRPIGAGAENVRRHEDYDS